LPRALSLRRTKKRGEKERIERVVVEKLVNFPTGTKSIGTKIN